MFTMERLSNLILIDKSFAKAVMALVEQMLLLFRLALDVKEEEWLPK